MLSYAIKLYLPVLLICLVSFYCLRPCFSSLLTPEQYKRAWIVVSLAVFVSFFGVNLWLAFIAMGCLMLWGQAYLGGGARGRLALLMLLLVIIPPLTLPVEGFAGINYFVELTFTRELALLLLAPLAFSRFYSSSRRRPGWVTAIDCSVLAYELLKLLLAYPTTNSSNLLRLFFTSCLDVLLPYYVVSRVIRTEDDLRFILSHFVLAGLLAAIVGITEFLVGHSFYSGLQWVYNAKWQLTLTLMRGDHLRVQAMAPTPIELAVQMLFVLGVWTYLRGSQWRTRSSLFAFGLAIACLLCTFSRGPWLGALTFALSLYGLKKLSLGGFKLLLVTVLMVGVLVKITGADDAAMNVLTGLFGSSEADTSSIVYRRELLDTALALIKQSPWLGVPNYAAQMESLRQGEGIIDLVNTYIAIALNAGIVGVALFLFPFSLVINKMLGANSRLPYQIRNEAVRKFSGSFVSLTIGLLLTIFTTSIGGTIFFLMMTLLSLPVAIFCMEVRASDDPSIGRKAQPTGGTESPAFA